MFTSTTKEILLKLYLLLFDFYIFILKAFKFFYDIFLLFKHSQIVL